MAGFSQVTPSKIVKVSTNSVSFNENLPSGTLLINIATGRQYLSLVPLSSTKTIGTCVLNTDIREIGEENDEIQDLSLSENTLSLSSDGTTVDLANYLDNTDNQQLIAGTRIGTTQQISIIGGNLISFDVADGDSNGTNELNTGITWDTETKTVSVTDAGGKKSVTISGFLQSELDGDATNELQDLALSDQTLSISSGNSIDLSGLGGASSLDGLSDVKYGGDNFRDGLFLGHTRTGTLNDARANLGIMDGALKSITSGDWNIGMGSSALSGITSGFLNIGIGSFSFTSLTTELGNVGLGANTGNKSRGSRNTAIGMDAMSNQDGVATENVAIGNEALKNLISRTSTITKNIAIGSKAGFESTGIGNIYLGYKSGSKGASTTDNNNIYIGYQSGFQVSGSNNIIMGIGTYPSINKYPFSEEAIPVFSNKLLIGHQGTPLITGDLGIANNGSTRSMTIYGDLKLKDGTILSSDERLKKDIAILPENLIKAISKLRPVQYCWKENDNGKHIGFIAQEVEQIFKDSGLNPKDYFVIHYDDEKDIYALSYSEFIAGILAYSQSLESRTKELEMKNTEIEMRLSIIEKLVLQK